MQCILITNRWNQHALKWDRNHHQDCWRNHGNWRETQEIGGCFEKKCLGDTDLNHIETKQVQLSFLHNFSVE